MSDVVIDFATRRAKKAAGSPPTREPDFELEGWLDEEGSVDWVVVRGDRSCPREDRALMLVDGAFTHAYASEDVGDRPAIWCLVRTDGLISLLWNKSLITGTNWRHGAWLLKQWWWVTRRWWLLAWRACRGRG